jgi:hypothetical protein
VLSRTGLVVLAGAGLSSCHDRSSEPKRESSTRAASIDAAPPIQRAEDPDRGWYRLERIAKEAGLSLEVGVGDRLGDESHRCLRNTNTGSRTCYPCELAHPADLDVDQANGLAEAIRTTPPSVLALAGVHGLVMCRTLVGDDPEHAIAGGTIDRATGEIFVAVDTRRNLVAAGNLFDHELYHLIDGQRSKDSAAPDVEWNALNPDGFFYSKAHAKRRPDRDGFVTPYAQTTESEDKAETYAAAARATISGLCSDHRGDAVVRAKVQLIHARLVAALEEREAQFFRDRATCMFQRPSEPVENPSQ